MLRFNLTAHVWRGIFLIALTTFVFYTFTERPPEGVHELGMSASVPRRQAPPPPNGQSPNYDVPNADCSYDIPNNIVLQPILETKTPILLNVFYRIGIYQDGNFILVTDSNYEGEMSDSRLNFLVCIEECSSLFASDLSSKFSVTILRDPAYLFTELFSDTSLKVKSFQAAGSDLATFLQNPQLYYSEDDFYAKNILTAKLGFDSKRNDENYIANTIQHMQNNFDFVIIMEHLLECLIYIKVKLCLDWEDIIFLYEPEQDEDKVQTSNDNSIKIRQWNKSDWTIYSHFNQTLWRELELIGLEQVQEEKRLFEFHLNRVRDVCAHVMLESDRQFCAELKLDDREIIEQIENNS